MKNSFKGFTLVEVLIVIIIVGILIAALLPRLVGAQARARDVAREGGINQIAQGVALMSADQVAFDALVNESGEETGVTSSIISSSYLVTVPTDPAAEDLSALCTGTYVAGQYCLANLGNAGYLVFATSETASGNCTVVAGNLTDTNSDGDADTALDLTLTNGIHSCVVVN